MTLAPLFAASFAIKLHTAAALLAAVFGAYVMLRRKGTASHRIAGYIFVAAITVTALSSFWITGIRPGHFSWIHILSVVTLISVPLGLYFRRKGNIGAHALNMVAPFAGLIIAGGFAFGPGRILHDVLFGP